MKIYGKISDVMNDIDAIGKDRTNKHQNYNFRGIEDLYNKLKPILTKHRIFCAPKVIDVKIYEYIKEKVSFRVMLTVDHVFYADDGSSVSVITTGEGIDTSDKATNKAMSAAMKYAFIELFSIPTEDIADSDRDHVEPDNDPSKYVVTFGQFKGYALKDIQIKDLENYVIYIESQSKEKNKPITGQVKEFLDNAINFINTFEQEMRSHNGR